MAFDYDAIEELEYEEHYQKAMRDLHGGRLDSQSPPQAEVVESDIHDNAVPVPAFPNGTAESQFEATQIQSQAATSASARPLPPPLPLVPPPEEHWATLIPDTANPACPRIEIKGTREKIRHVIGRRSKYPNKNRKAVPTDTILSHKVISGFHCAIWREWDPDAPGDSSLAITYLEDNSTNGTFVNGEKIKQQKIAIGDGDDISLGQIVEGRELESEFRFRFQLEYAKSERSQRRNPNEAGGLFLKYDIRGQIGSGSFAKVHRALHKKTGEWSAVKIIDKKRFKHSQTTMLLLQREIMIMKALDNPYIVKFHEGFEDENTVWLVIEYVSGGDLLDFVINKGGLSEYEASDVALQVCEAMSYLHQQGVAHRDLKPENILMTKGPQPRCKIADFGLAKLPGADTFLKTMCGTPTYLAPEVILQYSDSPGYSFAVDAWSVGVIIYSCIANASPFQEDEALPLVERMKTRTPDIDLLWEMGCSHAAVDFVSRFMQRDPAKRMTVYDAINHPWLFEHRRERALTKRQSSLTRLPGSFQSSGGSQQRRKAAPAGRHLTTVTSSRVTPPPPEPPRVDYTAPDSANAPASNWSSMGSLSRSHTLTDDENSDVVSEAPSYSQRLQRLRIESDFETTQEQGIDPFVVQDSQDSSEGQSKISLLAEDFTPPAAAPMGSNVDSTIYSQAGIKRKLPTSAFSSDESMQAMPQGESQQSTTTSNGVVIGNGSAIAPVPPAMSSELQSVLAAEPARIEMSNNIIAADYAIRDRKVSSASSDSSLSPVEESPPKSTPKNAPLNTKSTNSSGRKRSTSATPKTVTKAASQAPARRSTRLSAAHPTPTQYAESESEDGKASSSARKPSRARKQRRLSTQPSN